jgi:hypothetical protein
VEYLIRSRSKSATSVLCNVFSYAGKMGLDKFGGTAWGGVLDSASDWSKSNEAAEDDCIICMDAMVKDLTSLHCKHSFHTKVREQLYSFVLHCCMV